MPAILTPFPSPLPGLAQRRKAWNVLPFPAITPMPARAIPSTSLPAFPAVPISGQTGFPSSWPAPLTALPSPPDVTPAPAMPAGIPGIPSASAAQPAPQPEPAKTPPPKQEDFTDDDLREAFAPIVEHAVRKAVYARENGIDTYLEPMLRATIRRALAEYAPAARPFQAPGTLDRFIWHVQALFTSRTYEDIFFEKTRRFQVEEVFLFDSGSLALVSFASCDPARHSSARRVAGTAQRLALQLRDENGEIQPLLKLPDHRKVISRKGNHVILTAIVRGQAGELVFADLEFALRRIEDHFREQFEQEGSALLYPLQSFLEDCLLIQAPASAA